MAAVLRWMFVLVLLLLVAGSGGTYWLYYRSDEGLRQVVLAQLQTMAPSLRFELVRAQLDLMGRVRLSGLTAYLPDDDIDHPSLSVSEIIATLETTQLTSFENVVIQKLSIVKPVLNAVRRPDGQWNWQQASFVSTGTTPPDLEIEQGSVTVEYQLSDQKSRSREFQNISLSSQPIDAKHLLVQLGTVMEPAGPLNMEAELALNGSTWKVESRKPWRIPVDRHLIQLLADLSPEIAAKLTKAAEKIDQFKREQKLDVVDVAPLEAAPRLLPNPSSAIPDFGFSGVCEISFRTHKQSVEEPPTFNVLVNLVEGEIRHPLLPFDLSDLRGKIFVDSKQVLFNGLRAAHGPSKVSFDGEMIAGKPLVVKLGLRNVPLSPALAARLPEGLRKIIASTGVTGVCDADLGASYDGTWTKQVDLRLSKGTVKHERFPVVVRNVAGKLHLENRTVNFKAIGDYAGQPVEAGGTIINPGPEQEATITVKADNLPFDDETQAACPIPVMAAIRALNLRGRHDLLLRLKRSAGLGHKYEAELHEHVHGGSLSFNGFPYTVENVEASVSWAGDLVQFHEIKGTHDEARLTASGTFRRFPAPGRLELTIDANDAEFDRSLEKALPTALRQVWEQFQPLGNLDVKTDITWVPGTPCHVVLPLVKVREGEILMKGFPWILHSLKGEFSYNTQPGKLVIKEVVARHDDAELIVGGTGQFAPGEPWSLHFERMSIDNLVPNSTFRNALPESLQKGFDSLRPSGAFSFSGPIDFRQKEANSPVFEAAWKLRTILSRCAINAGSRIDEISGVVQLDGSWDGASAALAGELDLDSVSVFRKSSGSAYQINRVQGPIQFSQNRLVVGLEEAIPPRQSDTPPDERRIRGDAIDGKVFLDAVVELGQELEYEAFFELRSGHLERYAQQYLRGPSKLAGIMNGWLNVRGKGSNPDRMRGEGKLIVAPAALYELPLFAQMFQLAQLQSPARTAFDEAVLNLTVENAQFNLNSIDLQGEALNMRGRGYVRFDGGMRLDFGVTRRQIIPNPFRGQLIAIKVTGNVGDPKTTFVPFPQWDDAMRQFLSTFDSRRLSPRAGMTQGEMDSPR